MYEKLEAVAARYDELTNMLSDPEVLKDQQSFAKLSKEHAEKRPIVETYLKLKEVKQSLNDAHEILKGDDKELKELAEMEIEEAICISGVTAIESKGKENNKTGET